MKLEIHRNEISIIPENEQDHAFLEDTLGLKQNGAAIQLRRVNEVPLGYKPSEEGRFALITEKTQ